MGCFSFICKKSKKNVQENEGVYLFLLKDGVVIEEQHGNYNLYGNVDGYEWKMPWNDVCTLMFTGGKKNGIAAVRAECYNGIVPTEQSEDDPRQGTGRREVKKVDSSYHKVYDKTYPKVNWND